MKRAAALLALGVLAPMLQGGLAPFVPQGLFPDLSFLLVVSIGLCWRSASVPDPHWACAFAARS